MRIGNTTIAQCAIISHHGTSWCTYKYTISWTVCAIQLLSYEKYHPDANDISYLGLVVVLVSLRCHLWAGSVLRIHLEQEVDHYIQQVIWYFFMVIELIS